MKFSNEISNLGQIWVLEVNSYLSGQPDPPQTLKTMYAPSTPSMSRTLHGYVTKYLTTITPVYNIIYIDIYIIYNI